MQKEIQGTVREPMPRLFRNRIMDAIFSQVHFSVPLILYLPVVGYLSYRGIAVTGESAGTFVGLFLGGAFIWTFFEYALHRWWLHWIPDNRLGERMHFWLHGIHHDFPLDTRVVPPGRSLPGLAVLALVFYLVLGSVHWHGIFAGFLLGYLGYELVHYATHKARWQNKWFQRLQRHHMYHHFREPDSSYGFTGIFWDWVFRTRYQDVKKAED